MEYPFAFRTCWFFAILLIAHTVSGQSSTPPAISAIPDQSVYPGYATPSLAFTVGDAETPATALTLSGASSDTNLVSEANIVFGGEGSNRTVRVSSTPGVRGVAGITVTVADTDGQTNTASFIVRIEEFTIISSGLPDFRGTAPVWGDMDRDGLLDVIGAGRVYGNQGNGSFTNTQIYLSAIHGDRTELADCDNDGDLDLATAATDSYNSSAVTRAIRNDNGVFAQIGAPLVQVKNGNASWGDYDNDGRADLLVTGNWNTRLYHNDGLNVFSLASVDFPQLDFSAAAWADYDNDGRCDFVLAGDNGPLHVTWFYHNEGGGTFTAAVTNLPGLMEPALAWGDYDNDGDLDLAITGLDDVSYASKAFVYRNEGAGAFSDSGLPLIGIGRGGATWGDFNQDGWLDLVVCGFTNVFDSASEWIVFYQNSGTGALNELFRKQGGGYYAARAVDYDRDGRLDLLIGGQLHRNNHPLTNAPPGAPTSLNATTDGGGVTLSWSAPADANQTGGLTCNVRVGTAPGTGYALDPAANSTNGFRHVVRIGNVGERFGCMLTNIGGGAFYWSVQAVDHSYAGGAFATDQSFLLPVLRAQASTGPATNVTPTSAVLTASVNPGGASASAYFEYGLTTNYGARTATQAVGSESRWIPVSAALSNLTVGATNHFRAVAWNSAGTNYGADALFITPQFSPRTNTPVHSSMAYAAWGDYDNDGDLDCLMTFSEWANTRVYRNEGGGNFTPAYVSPLNGYPGTAEWADLDNDGWLDFASGSYDSGTYPPNFLRNNHDGTFSRLPNPMSSYFGAGIVHWGDYNNDGFPDLVFIPSGGAPRLFRNEGGTQFTDLGIAWGSLSAGVTAWGDFDKDSDLDIVVGGTGAGQVNTTTLYLNYNGGFYGNGQTFQGISGGCIETADFDNDGDLDLIMSGSINYSIYHPAATRVYRNNGNATFTEAPTAMPGFTYARIAVGDYSNDGRPDVFLQGITSSNSFASQLWVNQGNCAFADTGFVGENSPVSWADVDNDGALDFATTRWVSPSVRMIVYHNNNLVTNVPPAAPAGLSSSISGNTATLAWAAAADPNQNGGLTYNVMVGSVSNDVDALSPRALLTNGYRTVVERGNADTRLNLPLKNLVPGNYYWKVQAVDHAWAGSRFSTGATFIVNGPPVISDITNRATVLNTPTPPIPFVVRGIETAVTKLSLTAFSSNPALIPTNNIVFGGTNRNRTVTIYPTLNQSGSSTITIQVADANGLTASDSFVLTVEEFSDVTGTLVGYRNGDAAWGDYDNDGDLDLYITGFDSSLNKSVKLYRNNAGAGFTEVSSGLPYTVHGAFAWGDYNRDGYLDALICGDVSGISSKIYRNNGAGGFTLVTNLPYSNIGGEARAASWGDCDGDGDLDALVTGGGYARLYRNYDGTFWSSFFGDFPALEISAFSDYDGDGDQDVLVSSGTTTYLYRNDGTGTYTDSGIPFPPFGAGSLAWGDYDNDGDPDLVMTGVRTDVGAASRIFRNEGGTNFTEIDAGLLGVLDGSANWGDYDNDGDLDILLTGGTGSELNYSGHHTRIYRNDNGAFVDIGASLMGVAMGTGIWGDYDNDGDLDYYVMGITASVGFPYAKLYRNNHAPNQRPNPPASPTALIRGSSVRIAWAPTTDSNQPNAGLTYNLRVGAGSNGVSLVTPMANPTNGFRRLPAEGNMGRTFSFAATNLAPGLYSTAVQAVDHTFAGSQFSPETIFVVTKPGISDIPDQVILPDNLQPIPFTVSAIGTSLDSLSLTAVSSDTNLVPNENIVFGGSGSNRTITLTPVPRRSDTTVISISVTDTNGGYTNDTFAARVEAFSSVNLPADGVMRDFALPADFDNDGFPDLFVTGVTNSVRVSRVYRNAGNSTFTNNALALPPCLAGVAACGDFNRDGYLDLVLGGALGGSNVVRVFANNAGTGFTDAGFIVPGIDGNTRLAWGDYDNDGDLDLAVTTSAAIKLFRNDGGALSDSKISLIGVSQGSLAWGDYDNDGDLDLLFSGGAGPYCGIYQNIRNGAFALYTNGLPSVYGGNAVLGDYDNDGDLDVAACGYAQPGNNPFCDVFRNDGGNGFTNIGAGLEGFVQGRVAWGDFDSDGYLDLVTKANTQGSATHVYRNIGNGTFTDIGPGLPWMKEMFPSWTDTDRDGDLDLIIAGNTNTTSTTYGVFILRNNSPATNSVPTPPIGLSATLLPENDVLLTWWPGSDTQTAPAGLGYNLRIGTSPGGVDFLSPEADPGTGARRISRLGNAGPAQQWLLTDVPRGAKYWSVQAIDSSFAGSPFAPETSFIITNGRPTLSPFTNRVVFPNTSPLIVPFNVDDVEMAASNLVITVSSSHTNFVPNETLVVSGQETNRTLTVPWLGTADNLTTISVRVTDGGGLSVFNSFTLQLEQFATNAVLAAFNNGWVSWADAENDGDFDLFMFGTTGGGIASQAAYRNNGDSTFATFAAGLPSAYSGCLDWGDFDGDGDLDALIIGTSGSGAFTRIYRNSGAGSFTDIAAGLRPLYGGTAAWADYDGDGDLDALVTGSTNTAAANALMRLYRNNGASGFLETLTSLPGVYNGSMAWADSDNDGDPDLLLSGTPTSGSAFTRLYRNDGRAVFAQSASFGAFACRSVAWGDYDGDGDQDALLGETTATRLFRNDGGNNFTQVSSLPAIATGSVAWGDYDNDGDLDILLAGNNSLTVYRNDGNSVFANAGVNVPGVGNGAAAWGDFDKDGDLDFAALGSTNSLEGRVYRNNYNAENSPPTAPTSLAAAVARTNNVLISWAPASDAQTTNSAGLSYNLRIGTAPGLANLLPSHGNSTNGQRRLARFGNAGSGTQWRLSNLEAGTYYWSVQAIDTAFEPSVFAEEASFAVTNARPVISPITSQVIGPAGTAVIPFTIWDVETPASNLVLSAVSSATNIVPNSALSFGGAGANRSLIVQPVFTNGITVITVTVADTEGAYAFTNFTLTVHPFTSVATPFAPVQSSSVAWADYDNDGDLDVLLAGSPTNSGLYSLTVLYRNDGGVFTNSGVALPGVTSAAAAWGDYDNDGWLDLLLLGQTNYSSSTAITRLYRNNRNGTFTLTNSFAGIYSGAAAWGDYDNDGDLDLVIAGRNTSTSASSTMYRNNGNGTFTQVASPVPPSNSGAISWADLDNDGDLDIVATGSGIGSPLYRNNGSGAFTSVSSLIPPFSNSAQALADFDNDGDADILVAGLSSLATTRLYRNMGGFTFTNVTVAFASLQMASAAWGDYDNDGWPDLLLIGATNSPNAVTRLYRNLGGTNFAEITTGFSGAYSGTATLADYDNDGDLDFCFAGSDGIYIGGGYGALARLYRNNTAVVNTRPPAPSALGASVVLRSVTLTWTNAPDLEGTNSKGLSYALRVGTTPGGVERQPPSSDPATGYRRMPLVGLASNNRWALLNLPPGTYYWSVQSVDPALAGSPFAPEAGFVITNRLPVAIPQVIVMAEDSSRAITLTGSDADGQGITYSLLSNPTNGSLSGAVPSLTYRPKTNFFGGDSLSFQVSDGLTNSLPATVLLVVTGIQDTATITLSLNSGTGGRLRLGLMGEPYERYRLEATEDFIRWTPLPDFLYPTSLVDWIELDRTNYNQRFYRAAYDPPRPQLFPAGGSFSMLAAGEISRTYQLQASTNLAHWVVITSVLLTNPVTPVFDLQAGQFERRFYRLLSP